MAQENDDEFNQSPKVAMEVVKTTYEYMKKNGLLTFTATTVKKDGRREGSTAVAIAQFLAWNERKVEDIVANLRVTGQIAYDNPRGKPKESVPIEKELIESLPTNRVARVFRQVVQTTKAPRFQMIAPPFSPLFDSP